MSMGILSLCMCVSGAHRGQKTIPDCLELELQMVVSCPMLVLGTELSSPRAANAFSWWTIPPAPKIFIFKLLYLSKKTYMGEEKHHIYNLIFCFEKFCFVFLWKGSVM